MQRLSIILLTICTALIVVGCGKGVENGEVVGKKFVKSHYTTAYNSVYTGQTCSGSGENRFCSPNYIYVPYQKYHPDAWYPHLKNSEGKTGWLSVDTITYNNAKNGYEYQDGMLTPK